MKKKAPRSHPTPRSAGDNRAFVTLIRVAQESPSVGNRLRAILSLDDFNRRSALNTFVEQMRLNQAPEDFVSAIMALLDDAVAAKVRHLLSQND